jgi:hypothetical protein
VLPYPNKEGEKMAKPVVNIKLDKKMLKQMEENLKKMERTFVKVGVRVGERKEFARSETGKATKPTDEKSDLSNEEIGMIHEFGSPSKRIPVRSFIEMPLTVKRKELEKKIAESPMVRDAMIEGKVKKAFQLIGVIAEGFIQDAFNSDNGFGHWPSLSPKTIKKKGSSAILIDTAQLRRSIGSEVVMG